MPTFNNFALRFWLILLATLIALFVWFKPVLMPFLAGIAVAYFLEPVVSKLEKRGVPRWAGALIVLSGFLFVVAMIIILVWPLANSQISALLNSLPDYMAKIREHY